MQVFHLSQKDAFCRQNFLLSRSNRWCSSRPDDAVVRLNDKVGQERAVGRVSFIYYLNKYMSIILLNTISIFSLPNWAQEKDVFEEISAEITDHLKSYEVLYKHLHQNPELSFMEFETARRMAQELSTLGFEVTTNFGGNSVVGVYKNGKGKTLLLRTDMDALPILEKTGFIFTSKVRAKDNTGKELPVMHACGHDVHMTVWVGVANTLVKLKNYWKGTDLPPLHSPKFVPDYSKTIKTGIKAMSSAAIRLLNGN